MKEEEVKVGRKSKGFGLYSQDSGQPSRISEGRREWGEQCFR